jgi:hypothetical protein
VTGDAPRPPAHRADWVHQFPGMRRAPLASPRTPRGSPTTPRGYHLLDLGVQGLDGSRQVVDVPEVHPQQEGVVPAHLATTTSMAIARTSRASRFNRTRKAARSSIHATAGGRSRLPIPAILSYRHVHPRPPHTVENIGAGDRFSLRPDPPDSLTWPLSPHIFDRGHHCLPVSRGSSF